jgi:curli biogenesis system outer membrane secretion channel CsgG
MHEDKKSSNGTLSLHRARTSCSSRHCWALAPTQRLGLAASALSCWVAYAAADSLPSPTPPIKIAVFEFELEDVSAAGQANSVASETAYLAQATDEAEQQLRASGRYIVIDAAHSDISAAKGLGLRNCGGCEAPIALSLGADEALIGVVTKISMTEYTVRLRISDAQKSELVASYSTDLRMGADYSWSRGVRWLMQNRMLATK